MKVWVVTAIYCMEDDIDPLVAVGSTEAAAYAAMELLIKGEAIDYPEDRWLPSVPREYEVL